MATTPSRALSTLRPDLAGALMEFDLQANIDKMIGLKVAPVLEVAKPLGNYGVVPIEQLLKTRDTSRAPGGRYNQGGGKFEPGSFLCKDHGFEEPVDDRESEMYADYFDSELIAAMRARHAVLQGYESRVIAAALATTHTTTCTTIWTNSGAAPITDTTSAMGLFFHQFGRKANGLVISWPRFNVLKDNPQIIDRIKFAGILNPDRESITAQAIAQIFDIEEVIVAEAVYNSANEGAADAAAAATLATLWPETQMLLFCRPKTVDIREPAFMRTFHWGEDGSQIGGIIEAYRDESRRSNMIRSRMDTDEKVVYDQAALLMNDPA